MSEFVTISTVSELTNSIMQLTAKDCVFMCVGTTRVLCDSLGPRVGQGINDMMTKPTFVYGINDSNITAENLVHSYKTIKALHPTSQIVVIDAGVGAMTQVGKIQVVKGGISPGAATNKGLPVVGDISIIGIVADRCMADFYHNSVAKQNLIAKMVEMIIESIILCSHSQ